MTDIINKKTFMIFLIYFFHDIEKENNLWNLSLGINKTALILAALEGNKEIVELLLRQKDIDINLKDITNQKH